MKLDVEIALAHGLADAARAAILPHFRSGLASERKLDLSPVTMADRAAEEAMRRILTAECARDGVHGEEFGVSEGSTGRPGCSIRSTAPRRSSPAVRYSARLSRWWSMAGRCSG